jgi:hypothetical protein
MENLYKWLEQFTTGVIHLFFPFVGDMMRTVLPEQEASLQSEGSPVSFWISVCMIVLLVIEVIVFLRALHTGKNWRRAGLILVGELGILFGMWSMATGTMIFGVGVFLVFVASSISYWTKGVQALFASGRGIAGGLLVRVVGAVVYIIVFMAFASILSGYSKTYSDYFNLGRNLKVQSTHFGEFWSTGTKVMGEGVQHLNNAVSTVEPKLAVSTDTPAPTETLSKATKEVTATAKPGTKATKGPRPTDTRWPTRTATATKTPKPSATPTNCLSLTCYTPVVP